MYYIYVFVLYQIFFFVLYLPQSTRMRGGGEGRRGGGEGEGRREAFYAEVPREHV
jgi:hypothetical protein